MINENYQFTDVDALIEFASEFSTRLVKGNIVYLYGDLGSGKTSFVRAVLQKKGVSGTIKSPTYALIESYMVSGINYVHFDLYRLGGIEELELIGFRDYFDGSSIIFVEWPQKLSSLPMPVDYNIFLNRVNSTTMLKIQTVTK